MAFNILNKNIKLTLLRGVFIDCACHWPQSLPVLHHLRALLEVQAGQL